MGTSDNKRLLNIYLFIGPSGSGKTTVVDILEKRYGYVQVQSYTDRPPRYKGEVGHTFVTTEEFDKLTPMVAYTRFDGHQYGVTQDMLEASDLYVIDPAGADYLKNYYAGDRRLVVVGLIASKNKRKARMKKRGDTLESIKGRLDNDETAFSKMKNYCDLVIENNDLEKTVETIVNFIEKQEKITRRKNRQSTHHLLGR